MLFIEGFKVHLVVNLRTNHSRQIGGVHMHIWKHVYCWVNRTIFRLETFTLFPWVISTLILLRGVEIPSLNRWWGYNNRLIQKLINIRLIDLWILRSCSNWRELGLIWIGLRRLPWNSNFILLGRYQIIHLIIFSCPSKLSRTALRGDVIVLTKLQILKLGVTLSRKHWIRPRMRLEEIRSWRVNF